MRRPRRRRTAQSTDGAVEAGLREALVAVVSERGYRNTTVEMVAERANVPPATFLAHFEDLEECFLGAWDAICERFVERLRAAYESGGDWRERIRAAAHETVRFLDENPREAWVLVVEVAVAGRRARERRDRCIGGAVAEIDAGRRELETPRPVWPSTAEGIVGGAYHNIYRRLAHGRSDELARLVPEMMCIAVAPYLGIRPALEELRTATGPPG